MTYYRQLPASTPEQRRAIDSLFAERARLDALYARALAEWVAARSGTPVQLDMFNAPQQAETQAEEIA